ncbi:MAG: NAD(P)/FAD-dependent oxidoreductase, partial [Treponema sp.]|nr:NAD(P)/FAD-dependent oxidoreductase [Treponema sp.]
YEVNSYVNTKVLEIKPQSVVVESPDGVKELPCDCVVLALGYKPNTALADELEKAGVKIHKIAGAVKTSNAVAATREGFELGLKL